MANLNTDIQYLKGVGPKRASLLRKLGINTLEDLFYYVPKSYDDRSIFKTLNRCEFGERASFKLKVIGPSMIQRPRRNMSIMKIPISDGETNAYLVFFNQEYLKFQFETNKTYLVTGNKKRMGNEIQISNVVFEEENAANKNGKIVPIYNLTEGLTNKVLFNIIKQAIEENYYLIEEFLPRSILKKYGMMDRALAIKTIHFPNTRDSLVRARNRLVFEEFLVLQLGLYLIKNKGGQNLSGNIIKGKNLVKEFIDSLEFKLTNSQIKVFQEISEDMASNEQMNRLVQGDVGSGKTLVALLAMLEAVDAGYQSAMMAPTEILASQHFLSIKKFLKLFKVNIELLTGSTSKKSKETIVDELKDGKIDILIGTHALIEDEIKFKNLGLVITDEQHRFGVNQRSSLSNKGKNPDVLVMTATPIPRTLALILYGDLDISIIDELPPGRQEIETYSVSLSLESRVNSFIKDQIKLGRQAYIVCPLIEENDSLDIKSAKEVYDKLKDGDLKDLKLGLLHGKMPNSEKEDIMKLFKEGDLDVLVSTTVIEVGVDVPNSNTIVIYNAERFGLAQLHQLRGRVGRGKHKSYCILLNNSNNEIARERMRIMQATSDGFVISEKDLEIRGPGEFFGTRQHGLPELKIANIFKDMKVLKLAQKEADLLVANDKLLSNNENIFIKKEIIKKFEDMENISFN